jgi:hypothetical protein
MSVLFLSLPGRMFILYSIALFPLDMISERFDIPMYAASVPSTSQVVLELLLAFLCANAGQMWYAHKQREP